MAKSRRPKDGEPGEGGPPPPEPEAAPGAAGGAPPAAYLVFARKYRPRRFADLTGQEVIARTLRESLRIGRSAHAYLLAGPRGVGKTSAARLVGAALQCTAPADGEPCGTCTACTFVFGGAEDHDYWEIDGASHRGIEQVRAVAATVASPPARSRCRVFVIDEVHMLTREAFNALLKTLEEPPPHIKFLLATTAPERVPETVRSRCQRFDFRRIPDDVIAAHLGRILVAEGLTAEPGALAAIARKADGGLRDALSLLDQAFASGARALTAAELPRLLGWVPAAELVALALDVIRGDTRAVLQRVDAGYAEGRDPADLAAGCLGLARDVLVAAAGGAGLARLPGLERGAIEGLVAAAPTDRWLAFAQILSESGRRMEGGGGDARLQLELGLVTACRLGALEELSVVAARLEPGPAAPAATPRPPAPVAPVAAPMPPSSALPSPFPVSRPAAAPASAPVPRPPQPAPPVAAGPSSTAPAPIPLPPRAPAPPAPPPPAPASLAARWDQVLGAVAAQPRIAALLRTAVPLRVADGRFTVGVPQQVQKDHLESPALRGEVEPILVRVYGLPGAIRLQCELVAGAAPAAAPAPVAAEPAASGPPGLQRVLRALDGKVVPRTELERR